MKIQSRIFLALSDLRHRRGTVMLTIIAGALSAVYILTPGFYARGIYRQQRQSTEDASPLVVVAAVPDVQRKDLRFTADRLANVGAMPGVAMTFPAIEIGCSASLDGSKVFEVPAQDTVDGDPTLRALAWGTPVRQGAREVVLALPLFQRMGGTFDGSRPIPDTLTIEMRRTHAGKAQVDRQELQIVGLLRSHTSDKLFVPLDLADSMNLWCDGKADDAAKNTCDACWAYVPAEYEPRVAAEAAFLQLNAHRLGAIAIVDASDPRHRSMLARYRLTDVHGSGMTDDLLAMIASSRPTFVAVRPAIEVDALVGKEAAPVQLTGSDSTDPGRFAANLESGEWLNQADDIVLPAGTPLEVGAPEDESEPDGPHSILGKGVTAVFTRDGIAGPERLTLRLAIRGIANGPSGYANTALLKQIRAWQKGSLEYDARQAHFESPAEVVHRWGYVRATVVASDDENVETVVRELQGLGYRTEDQLASLEGLRRMVASLAGAVTLIVLGSLTAGALCVLVTSLLNLRQKRYEVGILRANGASSGDVLAIFVTQSLVLGAASFAVGAMITLAEPLARPALCQLIAIQPGMLHGSPLAVWWLPAAAFVVCVVTSLVASVLPALGVCRMSPVDLLRGRDSG